MIRIVLDNDLILHRQQAKGVFDIELNETMMVMMAVAMNYGKFFNCGNLNK